MMYASLSKLSKEGQAVFKLWIKTIKILFWSIDQELLGLLKVAILPNYYSV